MIKASELRIGNWVELNWDGQLGRLPVLGIIDDEKNIRIWFKEYDDFNIGCINSIPLTPEILERCGFSLEPQRQSIWVNGRLKLWMGHNGVIAYLKHEDSDESFYIPNNLSSLHQLQNLIYCLTGKEIEIDLTKNP